MSHLNKVILALLCAGALFYFDSREKTHVGNNLLGTTTDSIRIRIGGISLRSHCYVSVKKRRRPVICPVCEKWIRDVWAKTYSCTDSSIKRSLVFTYKGRK